MQTCLICIQTGKTVEDEDALEFETDEFYLKSTEEMYRAVLHRAGGLREHRQDRRDVQFRL